MILVTTGTMLPFDRMIRAMDAWAAAHPSEEVFAQTGNGSYEPSHMRWARLLGVDEFAQVIEKCSLVVAHAGTGSFFLAAEKMRPIVMFPRRAMFREHTTDHQVHTARWLRQKPGVYVAMTEDDLGDAIAQAMLQPEAIKSDIRPYAPQPFLSQIRNALLQ
jgi:UDP-N-acetylglucosamine transferase subunit ALG13